MGYDLRITRAPGLWAASDNGGISAEEWAHLVAEDPELTLEEGRETLARWRGASRHPDPWFKWWKGTITTKNPDSPIIEKMLQIAVLLRARVQGDDGEVYLPNGQVERDGVVAIGTAMDWRKW